MKEYLIRHTKDKIQGDVEDGIYEVILNWLKSHIFAAFITIEVAATAITAVAFNPDHRIKEAPRPASVQNVSVLSAQQVEDLTMKTPVYDYETQKQILIDHFSEWAEASEFVPYSTYYLSDLDQNGLFEITSTAIMGTGFFSETKRFEVNENMDGIHPVTYAQERDDTPDGFRTLSAADEKEVEVPLIGYYEPHEKTWYFITYDTWRAGWAANGSAYMLTYMKDGKLYEEPLGYYEYSASFDGSVETRKWLIDDVDYGSEEAFMAELQNRFTEYIPFEYTITSVNDDESQDPQQIVTAIMEGWSLTQTRLYPPY